MRVHEVLRLDVALPDVPGFEIAVRFAIEAAEKSGCRKSRRGAAVWNPDERMLMASGTNRPALGACDDSPACRRDCARTCIHAEQAVILHHPALRRLDGTELLHIKIDETSKPVTSGPPSCAECSKLILAAGIRGVWLLHESGWTRYPTDDFHRKTLAHLGLHGLGR